MKRIGYLTTLGLMVIALVLLGFFIPLPQVSGQNNVTFNIGGFSNNPDPCQNPYVLKTSVPINISSATTTEIVAAAAGKVVYACGVEVTVAGTSPTLKFEYGTKSSTPCDTGATALTGTFAPTSGTWLELGGTATVQMQTPAGNEYCAVTGGTSPSVQGYALVIQR